MFLLFKSSLEDIKIRSTPLDSFPEELRLTDLFGVTTVCEESRGTVLGDDTYGPPLALRNVNML